MEVALVRPVLAIFIILFLGVSGCVRGSPSNAASSFPAEGGAGVLGIVVSDELFPVIGADVYVVSGPSTRTDGAGAFRLPLAQGTYQLNATADGYEPFTMAVDVPFEAFTELRIVMTGIPGQAPYKRTLMHVGFDACSFAGVYNAGPIPSSNCPFGATSNRYRVEVNKEWAMGVHELAWTTPDNMAFASVVSTSNMSHGLRRDSCAFTTVNGQRAYDWCPALISGRSPLRIFVRPNDTEYAKVHSVNQKETWPGGENFTSRLVSSYAGFARNEINSTLHPACAQINSQAGFPPTWGCPFGVGYSTGIRTTYYHTTFYRQAPAGRLEDFTAIPDS